MGAAGGGVVDEPRWGERRRLNPARVAVDGSACACPVAGIDPHRRLHIPGGIHPDPLAKGDRLARSVGDVLHLRFGIKEEATNLGVRSRRVNAAPKRRHGTVRCDVVGKAAVEDVLARVSVIARLGYVPRFRSPVFRAAESLQGCPQQRLIRGVFGWTTGGRIEAGIQRRLLDERQDERAPRIGARQRLRTAVRRCARREIRAGVFVGQQALAEGPQVVHALHPPGRTAGRLNRRQEEADERADDGDHHQQLDQRESAAANGRPDEQ